MAILSTQNESEAPVKEVKFIDEEVDDRHLNTLEFVILLVCTIELRLAQHNQLYPLYVYVHVCISPCCPPEYREV